MAKNSKDKLLKLKFVVRRKEFILESQNIYKRIKCTIGINKKKKLARDV